MAARQREKLAALEKRNAELTAENRELKKLNKALVPQLESLKGRNVQLVKEVQNLKEGNSHAMGSLLGGDSMGRKRARSAALNGVSHTTSYVGSEPVGDGGRPPSPTGSSRPRGQTPSNAVSQQRAATSSPKKRRPPPMPGASNSAMNGGGMGGAMGAGGPGLGGMGQHISQLAAAMCNPFALPNPYSNPLFGPSPFTHPGALGLGGAGGGVSQPGAQSCAGKGDHSERDGQGKQQPGGGQDSQAHAQQDQHAAAAQTQVAQQQQQQTLFAAQMAQMAQMAHYAHLQQQQHQQQQSQQGGRGGASSAQLWPGLLPPAALFGQPNWHQPPPLPAETPGGSLSGDGRGETREQREARQAREGARDGALAVSQVFAAQRAAMLAKRAGWLSANANVNTGTGSGSYGGAGSGGGGELERLAQPSNLAAHAPNWPGQPDAGSVPPSQSRDVEPPAQAAQPPGADAAANRLSGDRVLELMQSYELDDNAGA